MQKKSWIFFRTSLNFWRKDLLKSIRAHRNQNNFYVKAKLKSILRIAIKLIWPYHIATNTFIVTIDAQIRNTFTTKITIISWKRQTLTDLMSIAMEKVGANLIIEKYKIVRIYRGRHLKSSESFFVKKKHKSFDYLG